MLHTWASWIRTNECSSQSAVPYPLAIAHCSAGQVLHKKLPEGEWWDSNPRSPEPQSGALTNCATPTITVPGGTRTPDPRLRRPLLYPAELQTHINRLEKRAAGDGNRTHVSSLEGWCSTIELHPQMPIGVTGFEPAASCSQSRRSSQAEPHPVIAMRHASP